MATDWYQQWLADKQQRDQQAQQNPQTNKVNFKQASMANNIQYTLPNFTGTSGNKGVNSQWEKDMLGPLSIKQYGRSYEDRFNNLTKSMGMNTYQAQDFRRYLDSQEAAKQGYVMKKDGTPDNRHTVTMGQGMQTQNQQIDGILKNMTNPNTPTNQLNTAIQNAGIQDMKVPSAQEQAQNQQDSKPHSWIYNNILNPVNNAVGGAVDYLERAGASGVDALTAGQFKKHINDASAQKALGTAGQQFAANETKDPTNLGQSAADVVGNLYATAPLFMGLGKVADPLANLLTANKYGQAAIRGGLSMGALATGQNAVDAAVNPNDATLAQRAKDIGLNTALGAGAEAGLTALGPVAQRIISKLTKGKPVSQIAKEEGIPEEQVHQVVNNYSNVLADKKPVMPNPIENPLNINLKQPSPSMDNFSLNPNQIPPVTVPPAANDLFSFIKGNVTPRGAVPKLDNVPRYGKENLQQKADAILQKALPPKFDKPVGYYQDLWNNVANHDGSVFHPQIQQILDHADMLSKDMTQKEQDFVHQYVQDRLSNVAVNDGHVAAIGKKGDLFPEDMRILMDTANQHEENLNTINQQASDYALNHPNYQKAAQKLIDNSGQTNEWQATKQLKQEYQNLKDSLDGINFTASDKANFGDIPQTFKTSSGGIDISKATELLGLKNPEETVNYLQSLAKANRTKMADVVTNPKLGTKAATEAQMKKLNALEKVLQSEYRSKAGAKGIKAQMQQALDLIAKGKGTNDFHAEAQKAFQDTPYFKSNQQLIDSMQQDLSKLQNPTKEDIYQALRQHNDPQTLQHFVDVATKDMKDFKNSRLKEALISDPRIKQMVKNMSPKKAGTAVPKNPQRPAPNFDEVLNLLEGKPNVKKGDKSFLNLKPKGKTQNIDKVLSSLKNEKSIPKQSAADSNIKPAAQPKQENVNNSQVKPETSSNLKPIGITPNQAHVNDISWVADPKNLARKIQDGDVSLGKTSQAAKTHVTSDLQFVKDIMRKIAKQDMGQTLTMMGRKMKDVSYEDNLFKGLRGVRRAVSEAVTASKHDYGKIIKTLRENKISQRDASEYFDAVHFNDILTNNHDKMVRAGDVAQRLQDIEHLVQNTNDKKVLKQLADEENKLLKEQKTLEPYTLPKEATPTKVQAVLDRWKNTPAMIQAQKDFMAAQRKDLELQVKSGLKSQAEVDAMISKHPNYVHMGRAKEGSDFSNGAGGNISKARQSIKARKNGSEENKKYTSLEGAIQNRIITYHNARRNMAMQTIEKIAKANGGSDFFTKLNPHAASDSQMQNTVKFFKNGEAQHYEVPPLLKQAFDSLDTRQAKDLVTKTIRAARNTIAKGATYFNTDFIFSSPLRETNALITSRTNLHPGQLVVGYLDSFLGKGLEKASGGLFKSYKEVYHELGGHYTGNVTVGPQDMRQFVKQMDKGTLGKGIQIINPANWITKLGASIEHGPKLAEFRSAKGKGYSDLNAMHEAADVIDYTDLGTTVRAANNYIPFLGPMVRGTTRYFQAMKENPAAWLGKNLMYITAPTIGIYAMRFAPYTTDEQRSKINNMTVFQKNLYWSIPAPDGKTIWAIPKMHVGAQLFANPVERVLDQITKQNPKTVSRLLKDTGNDVLTNLTPPNSISGLQLIMDSMANYNRLMDMPIEDTSMQRNPDLTKHFNSYTSEMAKELGKLTGGSPAKWDYVIKGMTGGTGRDVLDVTDNAIAKLKPGSRPSKVDTTLDILNPVRRYQYKDTSGLGTSDRLYQQNIQDKFDKKSTQATELYKQMSDINKQIKAIREDTKLSPQDKKDQISTLRDQQRKVGDQAIKSGVIRNR